MQFKDVYNVCINVSLVIMPSHHRHTLVKTNEKISTVGSLTGIEHRSHRSYAWAWEQVNTGQHQIKCSEGQMESGTQRGMFFFFIIFLWKSIEFSFAFHTIFETICIFAFFHFTGTKIHPESQNNEYLISFLHRLLIIACV